MIDEPKPTKPMPSGWSCALIYLCGCVVFTPLALWVIPQDRAAGWVLLIGVMVFGVLGIIGDLARTILMASHDAGGEEE